MTRRVWIAAGLALALGVALQCATPSLRHKVGTVTPVALARPIVPVYGTPTLYGLTIHIPNAGLKAVADDAAQTLDRMTGKTFTVQEGTAPSGIVLVRTDGAGLLPGEADRLKGSGPEAFYIRSSDARTLRIVANADLGLTHGLYRYLGELGCRWLLPTDAWTVIPARADVGVRIDRVESPAFRMRWFAGTGGFGSPSPVDPSMSIRSQWDVWKRRMAFGGEFSVGGHMGEAFALTHRAVMEAHPEYLALVNGKRSKWSLGVRLCVSNPDALKLFVDDRLAIMRRFGGGLLSVEPADGPGRCECDRCRAIGEGTESDQVYYLANQVARAAAKEMPGSGVSVFAYNQHAAPPSFPIERNVYVLTVPGGYQRTGMSPDQFVEAWRKKVEHVSLYAYWSLPDWSFDVPSFDWLHSPVDTARRAHAARVEGIMAETSFGAGPMGLGLYMAGRLFWNPEEDPAAIEDDFLHNAFGAAAPPMRRLLERWGVRFTPTPFELGTSYVDISEARAKAAADPAALRRVRDFEAYLHYIRLWFEYQGTGGASGSEPRRSRARAVISWAYRIYDTAMLSTYRLKYLISERREHDPVLKAEFDEHNPSGAGWASSRVAPSGEELDRLMKDGARQYPALPIEQRAYSGQLVRPKPPPPPVPPEPGPRRLMLAGSLDLELEVSPGRPFEIELAVNKSPFTTFDSVTITNDGGQVVHSENVPADWGWRTIRLEVPPGRYRCHVEDQKAAFQVRVPPGEAMVIPNLVSTDVSPRMYFWVPRGVHQVAMYVPSVVPIELYDADGTRVETPGMGVVSVPVPEGQAGRAWSLRNYKSWHTIQTLSVPQAFAFTPEALLVPESAIPAH